MNKNLKIALITLISSLIIFGCSTNELAQEHAHSDQIKNAVTFKEFKNKTKIKDFETVLKVSKITESDNHRSSNLNDYIIDTLVILENTNDLKATYSFRAYPTNEIPSANEKFNLVFHKVNNNWEKSLVKYNETIVANTKTYTNYENIYNSMGVSSLCYSLYITDLHCIGGGACDSGKCDLCYRCASTKTTVYPCGGDGGGPSDPNSNNGSDLYGNIIPYQFENNVFENPVYDDANYINTVKSAIFFINLQDAGKTWAYKNPTDYKSILDYMKANNWSSESVAFANLAIDSLNNAEEVDFEKDIIYGISKPCQKNIVKDVLDSCSPFINVINQTFNISSNANIKFSNGPLNIPNANVYTNPIYSGTPQSHTISIRFDDSFLNTATNLSIASNTLHELVHAYLMSLYLSGELVATDSKYNTLLNKFMAFYDNKTPDTFSPLDNELHNAMKDFISKMSNSLYNYALSKNINVTSEYCEQLAWGSMYGTDLFQAVLTPQQQIDYGNAATIEQDNMQGSKGTPCN